MSNINTREIACDTLVEILEHGSFSHIMVKNVLDKYAFLDKAQRGFLTRLVNGTVERVIELDYIIDNYSKTKVKKMKPLIRTLMRMGTYEIYYMDSVPASATCNEYVKLAKNRGFQGLSGFLNGVLRNIDRNKGILEYGDLSVKYSMPDWLCKKWIEDYGSEKAKEILGGFYKSQRLCVRVNLSQISRDELAAQLAKQGIDAKKDAELDGALYIDNFDSLNRIPQFNQGLFYVQDRSSMMVGYKAGIKKGDRVIDVCAAPGGKALHAAELCGEEGHVEARDLTDKKLFLIQENIRRCGAKNVSSKVWDATVKDDTAVEKADVVLADLPCSGLGILRKKPDIKLRMTLEQLDGIVQLQKEILDTVCDYVKEGGILCYSTCTINVDENERQTEAFLNRHPEFEKIDELQILPDERQDGFYICVMKR